MTGTNPDYVEIYDGSNDQDQRTRIEKLSGDLESFDILSTGNSLFVKFVSDSSLNNAGFLATIQYGDSIFEYQIILPTYFKNYH